MPPRYPRALGAPSVGALLSVPGLSLGQQRHDANQGTPDSFLKPHEPRQLRLDADPPPRLAPGSTLHFRNQSTSVFGTLSADTGTLDAGDPDRQRQDGQHRNDHIHGGVEPPSPLNPHGALSQFWVRG